MKKAIKKGFMLGIGAISLTTKATERILSNALKKSKITRMDSEKLVKEMVKETAKKAKKVAKYVDKEVNKKIKTAARMVKKKVIK